MPFLGASYGSVYLESFGSISGLPLLATCRDDASRPLTRPTSNIQANLRAVESLVEVEMNVRKTTSRSDSWSSAALGVYFGRGRRLDAARTAYQRFGICDQECLKKRESQA